MSDKTAKRIDRNSTSFALKLFEYFKSVKFDSKYDFLKYYQNIARSYMVDINSGSRGLLVKHTMGMGKSILAVALAVEFIKTHKIIMLLTKSLQDNMVKSVHKYIALRRKHEPDYLQGEVIDKWIERNFSFVSMNASNMITQVNRAAASNAFTEIDDVLENRLGAIVNGANLDGKLLIVDEAHNLFRAITNGSKNAMGLYDMVMRAKRFRCVFLTGTPISNDPFEIVPCFNMLHGYVGQQETLLPESYVAFTRLYVDRETGAVVNRERLQNRLMGMVSYISHTVSVGKGLGLELKSEVNFPTELPTEVIRVPMSSRQYAIYQLARDKEKEEGGPASQRHDVRMQKPKSKGSSTYRVRSRQLCNYCPPEGYTIEQSYTQLPADAFEGNKFNAVYPLITQNEGLCILYSQFAGIGGIGSFSRFLDSRGWKRYGANKPTPTSVNLNDEIEGGDDSEKWAASKVYAVIAGDVDPAERANLQEVYNSDQNADGSIIKLLLMTKTGAEGLDLKNTRCEFVLEPYWTYHLLEQFKARGLRNDSHTGLPPEKRNVKMWIMLSIAPKDVDPEGKIPTTDTEIYDDSVVNFNSNRSFNDMLNEISIECMVNNEQSHCRVCNPTDQPLFTMDPERDSRSVDNCQPLKETSVTATAVTVDGHDYFYSKDTTSVYGYVIYAKDEHLNKYKKLPETDPIYEAVLKAINDINVD